MEIKKIVAVMMSFGAGDQRARNVFEFQRLKYNIEQKIKVMHDGTTPVRYEVKVFLATAGEITRDAFELIAGADILICLIDSLNKNVIFELAVRNILKDIPLLIAEGDPREWLPIYLGNVGHIRKDELTDPLVKTYLDKNSVGPDAPRQFHDAISKNWEELLETYDENFRSVLQDQFQKIEDRHAVLRQDYIRPYVTGLNPGLVLYSWTAYYPYAVLRQRWKGKSTESRYAPTDTDGPLVIYDAKEKFFELFDDVRQTLPDPDGPEPLEVSSMIQRLSDYELVDKSDYEDFLKDQGALTEYIVYQGRRATASVPIRYNSKHSDANRRNKCVLPILMASRSVPPNVTDRPHETYYLIVYTEVDSKRRALPEEPGLKPEAVG